METGAGPWKPQKQKQHNAVIGVWWCNWWWWCCRRARSGWWAGAAQRGVLVTGLVGKLVGVLLELEEVRRGPRVLRGERPTYCRGGRGSKFTVQCSAVAVQQNPRAAECHAQCMHPCKHIHPAGRVLRYHCHNGNIGRPEKELHRIRRSPFGWDKNKPGRFVALSDLQEE